MDEARHFHTFQQDESGVTSIEYALLGSLIAMAIVSSVAILGENVEALYTMVANEVQCAVTTGSGCLP